MKSTSRMSVYVPIIQKFAARLVIFHSAVAARLGLNVTDVQSLRLLGDGSMSAGALAEEVGLTGAAVTALIDRLEKTGYVMRERGSDDRRKITVHANRKKLQEIDALYEAQGAKMNNLLAQYSAKEFQIIADFLEQTTHVLAEEAQRLKDSVAAKADRASGNKRAR
jgi:DNA-binding MarR family transcriptional regulator